MRLRSIGILSSLGLLGLVLLVNGAHAQGMAPGQAAPPLPSLDLTKPGSPRPSAITQKTAPVPGPAAAAPAAPPSAAAPTAKPPKAPPLVTKGPPAKAKPGTVAASTPPTTKKAPAAKPAKATKGKPPAKPTTQTATAGDR